MSARIPTDDETIELADMFKLLGDPSRLRIILATLGKPLPVGVIAARLDLSPSLVSHHLRLLRAARLVRPQRHGREIRYSLHDAHVRQIIEDMLAHIGEAAHDPVERTTP